ncbi:hypothetical protein [Candidatus Poriferisodalis sp.]|uniref:hypothetical protein n=1 Tax=Candidatus Poriferisodalis sp. TaxID=3101277 RepID=UPI003AF4578F
MRTDRKRAMRKSPTPRTAKALTLAELKELAASAPRDCSDDYKPGPAIGTAAPEAV